MLLRLVVGPLVVLSVVGLGGGTREEGQVASLRVVGGVQVRFSPWYGSGGAVLLSAPPRVWVHNPDFLARAMALGRESGYSRFLVQATSEAQRQVLSAAGYEQVDELYVLYRSNGRPLPEVSAMPGLARLGRGLRAHQEEVIAVDRRCFEPFWAMNHAALAEALLATPRTRFRVLTYGDEDRVIGYAIFGMGGGEGYLQRIAVDPEFQRRGFATRMIVDGLRWSKRWRARRVGVNTQRRNHTALQLYLSLGFEMAPEGIAIYAPPRL